MDQDPSSTISPRLSPCLAPPHHRFDFLLLSLLFLDPLRFTLLFLLLYSVPPSAPSSPPLLLLLLILPYSRRSLRCIAPQQEQTSLRGRHGATESRWMDLSRSSLDPPELSRGPPRGFTWPEVRHQRNTCSMKPSYESLGGYTPRVVARPRTSGAGAGTGALISMEPPSTRCWRMISFDSFALVCDGVVIDR